MSAFEIIIIVLSLVVFEVVSSIDNAIINAEVLSTMGERARRWFITWGIFLAVFVVRGLLPLIIVAVTNPSLTMREVILAMFSSDPRVAASIEHASPTLMTGGGIFLALLFLHWFFLEKKNIILRIEQGWGHLRVWHASIVTLVLGGSMWFAWQINHAMTYSIGIAATVFFVILSVRKYVERNEMKALRARNLSDVSKIAYLETIDSTFSIDGVIGAFAFTLSVPLILIGNGLGALVVRHVTTHNIERIKKYRFLKNGAMYSILYLSIVMISESFGLAIPTLASPVITFIVVGYFLMKSRVALRADAALSVTPTAACSATAKRIQ